MTTYTAAFFDSLVIATVPDGGDIDAAIKDYEEAAGAAFDEDEIFVETGLTLTDDPEDTDEIVFKTGSHTGYLVGADGMSYKYAIRR